MTDEPRQAPQYGEYATPEEVALAAGRTPEPATASAPRPATSPDAHPTPSPSPQPAPHPSPQPAPVARPRRWDAPLTIGLLVVGFIWTASSFSGYLDFAATLNQAIAATQLDLTFGDDADPAGIALLLIHSVLLLGALGLSVALIGRGRLAFWVPVLAGLAAFAADIVVLGLLIANHPDYASLLTERP